MKNVLSIGFFFGCICYVVCGYFLNGYLPIIMGIFTWIIFSLSIYVILLWSTKKQLKLISGIEQDILLKDSVNFYGKDGLSNGLLFLTEQKLFFYESEKKYNKYEYPLEKIVNIEYGKLFRHIKGCIIILQNNDTVKFAMTEKEYFKWVKKIEELSNKRFGSVY